MASLPEEPPIPSSNPDRVIAEEEEDQQKEQKEATEQKAETCAAKEEKQKEATEERADALAEEKRGKEEDEEEEEEEQKETARQRATSGADSETPKGTHMSAAYRFPREGPKRDFAVPDLVWGKVMGYPWWPGQILDPSYASRKAVKHRKKDRFLVAYFGDKTFSWCSPSQLKPLLPSFGELERQSVSNAFLNAVRGAVAEAARRADVGMVCPCVPEDLYPDVRCQRPENAGIRKGVAIPTADASLGPSSFVPEEFVDCVRALAVCPEGEFGALDLAVAQAQLMAYRRSQGCAGLCTFYVGRGLQEDDGATESSKTLHENPDSIPVDEEKPAGIVENAGVAEDFKSSEEHLDWIPMDEERLADFVSQKMGQRTWIGSCRKRKDTSEEGRSQKKRSGSSEKRNGSLEHTGEKVYGRKDKKTTATPGSVGQSKEETFESGEKHTRAKVSSRKGKKKTAGIPRNMDDNEEDAFKSEKKHIREKVSNWKGKKTATLRNVDDSEEDTFESEKKQTHEKVSSRKGKKTATTLCNVDDSKGDTFESEDKHIGRKVSGRKRKKAAATPHSVDESNEESFESEKSELMDDLVKKSLPSVSYQSFKVGEFIRRVATKLTNSSTILKTNGATLQKSEVEDKPLTSSSSNGMKTSKEAKQHHGKDKASSDEANEPPGEIKYSRRHKTKAVY